MLGAIPGADHVKWVFITKDVLILRAWGFSSVGRALRSQCRGRGFDSRKLHFLPVRPRWRGASLVRRRCGVRVPKPALCGSSSVGRALAFQARRRGFDPRLPLYGAVAKLIRHQSAKLTCAGLTPACASSHDSMTSLTAFHFLQFGVFCSSAAVGFRASPFCGWSKTSGYLRRTVTLIEHLVQTSSTCAMSMFISTV